MKGCIAAFLMLLPASVLAQPSCFFESSAPVALHAKGDRAAVLITNLPCPIAHIQITIADSKGTFLYYFKEELSVLLGELDDPQAPFEAEALAKEILVDLGKPRQWLEDLGGDFGGECSLVVPKRYYKKLKASERALLFHQTYNEGGKYFVFVSELGQSIDVARCGS